MLKSPWLVAGICLIVVGCLVWFLIRRGDRLRRWLHEPVEPGKPRWTYALTPLAAALAPLAAFSVLLPSYFNQQQSDRKFMAEAGRSRTDAEWNRLRLQTETQEARFGGVQARLGSPDARTRAVAALQLADMALLSEPAASGGSFDDRSHPHFAPSGVQLALALQMERDADVRAASGSAMRKLVAFARENQNPAWQYGLANELADANRHVNRAFTRSLARYAAANDVTNGATLRVLATVAPLVPQTGTGSETTTAVLNRLMAAGSFPAERRVAARLREASPPERRGAADGSLLAGVQAHAAHLVDSRDALADALRAVRPAAERPSAEAGQSRHRLRLRDCFLAGADLRKVPLNDADVAGAHLDGADLTGADLTGANVKAAGHLPPSVTRATFGPGEQLQAVKSKYRWYEWGAAAQARKATGAAGRGGQAPPTGVPKP